MTTKTRTTLSCLALALLAGSAAAQTPASYPLMGIVRDFAPQHTDFAGSPADGAASSAGNIARSLPEGTVPAYTGAGLSVVSPCRDASARPIAPHLYTAGTGGEPLTDFSISGASIQSSKPMAAKVRVIGAAISMGGQYDLCVTTRVKVGSALQAPFGAFDKAVTGNVNDNQNPRSVVLPNLIPAGTRLSVDGQSWTRNNASSPSPADADWSSYMTINSESGGRQVVALRNGDTPPDVSGFMGQVSAKDMLTPYMNAGKITLLDNQVIYLFELGTTSTGSSAFDMQDLVVLVDLATDPSYFDPPPTDNVCVRVNDTPAVRGSADTGRVTSASTFATWFQDAPGHNASIAYALDMVRDADGVYAFSAPDFDPAHGALYSPQGDAPNRGFTYAIDATSTYTACGRQFIEVASDTEAWAYINGRLVVDMGGTHRGATQFVDLDRLGLTAGQQVRVQIFYAQRCSDLAAFGLRTNMVLSSTRHVAQPGVSGLHD
ncbi:MAG: fibro-slime domain-containing protein [Phycisphaerales bacterium]